MSKSSKQKTDAGLQREIPIGLGMALSMNVPAMEKFSAMDASGQDSIIRSASSVKSRNEMQTLVEQIAEGTFSPGL